jgi:hypothetical protein
MPRPRIHRRFLASTAAVAALAILLVCGTSSCNSPSFQYLASTSMPVEMPYAPQPPPAPMNVARLLNGNWMATYLCVANS